MMLPLIVRERSDNNYMTDHFFFKICAEFHEPSVVCTEDH